MSLAATTRREILDAVRVALADGNRDPLLSLAQVVTLTGFHKRTLRRYVDERTLPCERVGPTRRVFFRWSVVKANWPEDAQRL